MNFIFPYIVNVIIPTDFHSIIFQPEMPWILRFFPNGFQGLTIMLGILQP